MKESVTVECFRRRGFDGWDVWGDEAPVYWGYAPKAHERAFIG